MDYQLREVNCQKAISGTAFSQGLQDFNFNIGGASVMHPEKSFFAAELELKIWDGTNLITPRESDQIALSRDPVSCLYDNVTALGGGADISSLKSFCPQAHMINERLTKSGAYMNSMGASAFGMEVLLKDRIKNTSTGDIPSDELRRTNVGAPSFELSRTLSIVENTGNLVGINTDFLGTLTQTAIGAESVLTPLLRVGDICMIPRVRGVTQHTVTAVTSNTQATISPSIGLGSVVATKDIYFVRDLAAGNGRSTKTVLWRPSIAFFGVEQIGSGDFRISLNPSSRYQQNAVESVTNAPVYNASAPVVGSFQLQVNNVKFYIALSKAAQPLSGVEELFMQEMHLQSKPLTGKSNSLDFTVPGSTKMLCFMLQSDKVGSDIKYSPTSFKCENNNDLSISSFQLTYANRSRPSTRWGSELSNTRNTMHQRYYETFSECGLSELQGGCEKFSEWLESPIYCYRFDRDSSEKSTQVQLNIDLKDFAPGSNVIMCAFYSRTVEIAYANGMIQEIRSLNV
jgi:hypothetical protein